VNGGDSMMGLGMVMVVLVFCAISSSDDIIALVAVCGSRGCCVGPPQSGARQTWVPLIRAMRQPPLGLRTELKRPAFRKA